MLLWFRCRLVILHLGGNCEDWSVSYSSSCSPSSFLNFLNINKLLALYIPSFVSFLTLTLSTSAALTQQIRHSYTPDIRLIIYLIPLKVSINFSLFKLPYDFTKSLEITTGGFLVLVSLYATSQNKLISMYILTSPPPFLPSNHIPKNVTHIPLPA